MYMYCPSPAPLLCSQHHESCAPALGAARAAVVVSVSPVNSVQWSCCGARCTLGTKPALHPPISCLSLTSALAICHG